MNFPLDNCVIRYSEIKKDSGVDSLVSMLLHDLTFQSAILIDEIVVHDPNQRVKVILTSLQQFAEAFQDSIIIYQLDLTPKDAGGSSRLVKICNEKTIMSVAGFRSLDQYLSSSDTELLVYPTNVIGSLFEELGDAFLADVLDEILYTSDKGRLDKIISRLNEENGNSGLEFLYSVLGQVLGRSDMKSSVSSGKQECRKTKTSSGANDMPVIMAF